MHLGPSRVSAAEDVATAPDLCEMFTMSRLGEPGVAAGAGLDGAPDGWHAPNIWPDRPADLRADVARVLRGDGGAGRTT